MSYQNIAWHQKDPILQITVNRPDKLNALNLETLIELTEAFKTAANDDNINVVILTGSGEKAFVAGADIKQINQLTAIQARDFSETGQRLMLQIENLGKPVIAAINGFALGGGCELALACNIR